MRKFVLFIHGYDSGIPGQQTTYSIGMRDDDEDAYYIDPRYPRFEDGPTAKLVVDALNEKQQ